MSFSKKLSCSLLIRDLRLWVYLGCSAEERFNSQLVSIDIDFAFDTPPAGLITDRLEDTICYLEIVKAVKSFVQSKQFNLIEHFTHSVYIAIVSLLKQRSCIISSIRITTNKVALPVPNVHGGVLFSSYTLLDKEEDK